MEVPTVWARTSGSQKFQCKQPGVPSPTWNSLQVLKWTLSERYLTTPLPSGKVKCWGCSFDAGRSPLHKSSPNPKTRVGEEDKPTRTNIIEQITTTTTSTYDTRIYHEVRQLHKGAPTSSLLRWPPRSESLPPPCLSQSNHKGYLSFSLRNQG